MAKKLNSVVGIDIGSRSIKVAELKSQGRDVVVTALGMADTPEGAVDHTGIYNGDAVANAVKAALQHAGSGVSAAVVSIAGQASVLVRTLEVPKMSPTELREHMQWEINRNIPFAESTVVSDFKVLGDEDPNAQNMDVVMAISPQSAVDALMSCIRKAGRQLAAIDVEPLGLARSVHTSYGEDWKDETVCLVDVGHKTTSINIYKNGKLLMPRQVPVGGEMFVKALADARGVGAEDAESLLRRVDLSGVQTGAGGTQEFQPYNPFAEGGEAPPAEAQAVPAEGDAPAEGAEAAESPAPAAPEPAASSDDAKALSDVMGEFIAEIRRSIDYFKSKGGDVSRLAVCGGGARLKGLEKYLNQALGLPCDLYDPLHRLQINAKKADADYVDAHRQEFAVAVGNGLYILYD